MISGILGLLSFTRFLVGAKPWQPCWSGDHHSEESSVLFAMAIGVLRHHEPLSLRRLNGAVLVLLALVVIAL